MGKILYKNYKVIRILREYQMIEIGSNPKLIENCSIFVCIFAEIYIFYSPQSFLK